MDAEGDGEERGFGRGSGAHRAVEGTVHDDTTQRSGIESGFLRSRQIFGRNSSVLLMNLQESGSQL